jgi:hypothetical protein
VGRPVADWPYPVDWYRKHTVPPLVDASRALGRAVDNMFCPRSVVDVGCGVGAVLAGLLENSQEDAVDAIGYEHPSAVEILRKDDLWLPGTTAWLWPLDLEHGWAGLPPSDVITCTEVGEHLSPAAGANLVTQVCRAADLVVWSAAIPGQGGEGHVNERPEEYWAELFRASGFRPYRGATLNLRAGLAPFIQGSPWYSRVGVYAK